MKISGEGLTVFPTELAKRRTERRLVLEQGVLDTSCFFTQKKLLDLCERAARRAGLLIGRSAGTTETRILLEEAAGTVRFAPGQPLAKLFVSARAKLLEQTIDTFAVFADSEAVIVQWLLAHEPDHKLHGIGQLLQAWRKLCDQKQIADRFILNTALLRLIGSGELPRELQNGITFRAVRWFNPFEERFAAALKNRLGPENIRIVSALPAAHAEAAEDRLCAAVRSELMRGAEEEWKPWLEDFADAFEADDSNILEAESQERVGLFVSSNPYGEIEDAARRIAGEIEAGTPPEEIALILRDLSPCTDIVPDVFRRFGIPYHFRRGTPAAAHPPVKALLALLAFPQNPQRDRLYDLLLSPGIQWPGIENREELAQKIRQTEPPRLRRPPKELAGFFQTLPFSERVHSILQQHGLQLPGNVLELIDEIAAINHRTSTEQMISLFEELLENITLTDEFSTESGVWVINAMDAAGLRFESVHIAGMDDRSFPQIPKADGLLNGTERKALKKFLTERKIFCPRLALSEAGEALIQEEILFLTAMSAARERLALSYTRADADGKERAPGEFYERMRGLTGREPRLGASFHTILPPEACRAEDEVRQTRAKLSAGSNASPKVPDLGKIQPLIFQWLEKNPEFSATALESLARNRFVFFLEKALSIKPDRTHEDDTDPMDRGSLIHDILEQVYTAVAEQSSWYARKVSNGWKFSQEGEIPLAVFNPNQAADLLALTHSIAEEEFRKAERRPSRHLGHPAVWETEKRKLLQIVENFVRMDIETAQSENRYPALFEMKFDAAHDLPVVLHRNDDEIQLKGKIDRVDLIFDSNGNLERLLVVDYKSKSRGVPMSQLEKEVALSLDCQLPLYTFAAQQKFFGACNTPELNSMVQAVYHLQERDLKTMTSHFHRKRLAMTSELNETFLNQLFSNVWKLRSGDLATEPLIAHYDDYSHICRTTAIDPKDLLKEA
ncbi:MAG: PD-(D/E)XK nuclease family protein [Kiritimatiellales bacterium]